jgi:hypothetical protein
VIEDTLEFVMHLDTLIGALASRPSASPAAHVATPGPMGMSGYGGR